MVEDVGLICVFGFGLEVVFTGDFGGLEVDDVGGVLILGGACILPFNLLNEGLRDLALAAILDDALVGGGVV